MCVSFENRTCLVFRWSVYLVGTIVTAIEFPTKFSWDWLQVHEVAKPGTNAFSHFVLTWTKCGSNIWIPDALKVGLWMANSKMASQNVENHSKLDKKSEFQTGLTKWWPFCQNLSKTQQFHIVSNIRILTILSIQIHTQERRLPKRQFPNQVKSF